MEEGDRPRSSILRSVLHRRMPFTIDVHSGDHSQPHRRLGPGPAERATLVTVLFPSKARETCSSASFELLFPKTSMASGAVPVEKLGNWGVGAQWWTRSRSSAYGSHITSNPDQQLALMRPRSHSTLCLRSTEALSKAPGKSWPDMARSRSGRLFWLSLESSFVFFIFD